MGKEKKKVRKERWRGGREAGYGSHAAPFSLQKIEEIRSRLERERGSGEEDSFKYLQAIENAFATAGYCRVRPQASGTGEPIMAPL